jgi:hypothetical protein
LAAVCVAGLSYLALTYFVETPLPHSQDAVHYYPDTVWDISCAAEAKNHWPITDSRAAGESFYYYTFVFMHMAAASRITGLELPLVVLRLYIVSFFLLLIVQLYVLGARAGKSHTAGLLAAVIGVFVGEVTVVPNLPAGCFFLNTFFTALIHSPTFLLGLLMFLPLVIELRELLATPTAKGSAGSWLVIALLLIASGGAKATVPPVVAGGLGLYLVWCFFVERRIDFVALAGDQSFSPDERNMQTPVRDPCVFRKK